MSNDFIESIYNEIESSSQKYSSNVIKKDLFELVGNTRIELHEETDDGVKILLKKDELDNVKEIKFVCSCGETKSVILDYNE